MATTAKQVEQKRGRGALQSDKTTEALRLVDAEGLSLYAAARATGIYYSTIHAAHKRRELARAAEKRRRRRK